MSAHTVGTRRRGGRMLAAGAAGLVLAALLGAFTLAGRTEDGKVTVTAVFTDSSPLVTGNRVRLDGMDVGVISDIRLVNGQAHVDMSLDRMVLPLHADASAKIQPVSLLGERFIALGKGSSSAPALSEPLVIPVGGTGSSVDLDQLLNTLDDPASAGLAATVGTLGEGLAGQGDAVAKALEVLAPTLHQTDQLAALLDRQNAVLDHLVVTAQRNGTAFAEPLDSLVAGAEQTLGVVAANREALDQALVELPGTLAAARRTLAQLANTSENATDVLADIRPLTGDLVGASRELHEFADAADPALAALPGVLDRLNHMLDEARPVVDSLSPAAAGLSGVSGSVHDLGEDLVRHAPGVPSQLENLMTGVANWAMATSGYDGLSHYFRAVVHLSPSSLANTGIGALPPVTRRPLANPVPEDPNGRSRPGSPALPNIASLPSADGPDNSSHTDPNSASGLTTEQETNMFGQLLGGGR